MSQEAQISPNQRLAKIKERQVAARRDLDRMAMSLESIQEELKKATEKSIAAHGTDNVSELRTKLQADKAMDATIMKDAEDTLDVVEAIISTANAAVAALRVS
ncbi:hypothetical protein [Pseudomonas serbica]|jgi:hypothetical protein|uniref:hypothetical protein n=1 Tax=Pseudomonas serbica TaxID=2965074 RepID=UPI00237A5640|nr:hypothetical protein [Pseudomonas serbica]